VARLTRLGLGGWPHLVVQPVQDGQSLWRDAHDALALHAALVEAARQHGVSVHAYRLGGDASAPHPALALVLTPSTDEALGAFMQAVGRRYVAAYNRRHARQGSLWAGRYRSTVLDAARYLLDAMQWVEQPAWPSAAGAGARVCSFSHHLGAGSDALVTDPSAFWALGNTPFDRELVWRRRLDQGLPAELSSLLSEAVHKGWALVPQDEAPQLEKLTGRRVQPRPRGRPRKALTPSP
jgi:putative transposase